MILGLKLALETGAVRHKMTSKQRCLLLRHLTLEQSTNIDTLRNEVELHDHDFVFVGYIVLCCIYF